METHSDVGREGRAVIAEERQLRLKRFSGRTAKQRQEVGVWCWGRSERNDLRVHKKMEQMEGRPVLFVGEKCTHRG